MLITRQEQKLIDWCADNISAQTYYLPFNHGVKVGGEGWEISTSNNVASVFIEKEEFKTWIALAFKVI